MINLLIKHWPTILAALIILAIIYAVFFSNLFVDASSNLSDENLGDY